MLYAIGPKDAYDAALAANPRAVTVIGRREARHMGFSSFPGAEVWLQRHVAERVASEHVGYAAYGIEATLSDITIERGRRYLVASVPVVGI